MLKSGISAMVRVPARLGGRNERVNHEAFIVRYTGAFTCSGLTQDAQPLLSA